MRIGAGGEEKSRGGRFFAGVGGFWAVIAWDWVFLCVVWRDFLGGLHSEAAIGMSWRVC